MVLAVAAVEEAFGPRVAMVPVKGARNGEIGVFGRGVGGVADESVDPVYCNQH